MHTSERCVPLLRWRSMESSTISCQLICPPPSSWHAPQWPWLGTQVFPASNPHSVGGLVIDAPHLPTQTSKQAEGAVDSASAGQIWARRRFRAPPLVFCCLLCVSMRPGCFAAPLLLAARQLMRVLAPSAGPEPSCRRRSTGAPTPSPRCTTCSLVLRHTSVGGATLGDRRDFSGAHAR